MPVPRQKLDQYYTKPDVIKNLVSIIKKKVPDWNEMHWIDFSAGNNDFIRLLGPDRWTAFDIEPKSKGIIKKDWLKVTNKDVKNSKRYAIGFNPPFGKSAVLARKFIKHAEIVFKPEVYCLISPMRTVSFLHETHKTIHQKLNPKDSFYLASGEIFSFSTPFTILKRRINRISNGKVKNFSKNIMLIKTLNRKKLSVEGVDMLISLVGSSHAAHNVFIRKGNTWDLYRVGEKVVSRLAHPNDSHLSLSGVAWATIKFKPHVKHSDMVRITKKLPKLIPREALLRTPIYISMDNMRKMIDKALRLI